MSEGIWTEICIHTQEEAIDAISEILYSFGISGIAIEDSSLLRQSFDSLYGELYVLSASDYPSTGVNIKGYLPNGVFPDASLDELKKAISKIAKFSINYQPATISLKQVKEEDWACAWKKYYKLTKITDRITICPSWETYNAGEDELVIKLDPGMAFGTGTHPTTTLAVKNLEKYIKSGDLVYDVGCGSGVLSIVAAKLGASQVNAYDIDPLAIKSSNENIHFNKVDDIVLVSHNNLLDGLVKKADIIVANILAEVILLMTNNISPLLQDKGYFIGSGIIQDKEREVIEALENSGLNVIDSIREGEWLSLVCQNKI